MHGGGERNELAGLGSALPLVEAGMAGFTGGRASGLLHACRAGCVIATCRCEGRGQRKDAKDGNGESRGGIHDRFLDGSQ